MTMDFLCTTSAARLRQAWTSNRLSKPLMFNPCLVQLPCFPLVDERHDDSKHFLHGGRDTKHRLGID